MDKLYKRFQERAFTLFRLLLVSIRDALGYLRDQIRRLIPQCLKERQRSRMTTLGCLDAQCDPALPVHAPAMRKLVA